MFKSEYKKINEDISLDDNARKEIIEAMKRAQSETNTTIYKKRNVKAYIVIAAAAVLIFSSIGIMAANNLFGEEFGKYFNWLDRQNAKYNIYNGTAELEQYNFMSADELLQIGEDLNISTENNGYNVCLKKIISDSSCVFALFELTTYDNSIISSKLDDSALLLSSGIISDDYHIRSITLDSYSNTYNKISTDENGLNTWQLFIKYSLLKTGSTTFDGSEIILSGHSDGGGNKFTVTIPLSDEIMIYNGTSCSSDKEYNIFDDINIYDISITPMALTFTADMEEELLIDENITEKLQAAEFKFIFNDNTYFTMKGNYYAEGVSTISYFNFTFPKAIRLENLKEVTVNGETIDLKMN